MFNSVIIVTVVLAAEGHPQFSKCLRNKWPMHPHQNMRKDLNNDVTYFTAIDMMFFQAVEKPVFLKGWQCLFMKCRQENYFQKKQSRRCR